jgi:FkbM family methyltransferase
MSFVSYAQNFEDVMLWRALSRIEEGFYIDVGAAWPEQDSVTKAFYDMGWNGINIEPNAELYLRLIEKRPRDINLKLAIGDVEGTMSMSVLANTGLSTLEDSIARQHQESGFVTSLHEVEIRTLAYIWRRYVPEGQQVHFLKVDVEGFEQPALRGNEWSKYRPWVVVVEATRPMSQAESYACWEPTLEEAGYSFAYADGLNRFYVARERADLLPAFKYPPNVFDSFILAAHQQSEARAMKAENVAQQSEARAMKAENVAQQSEARAMKAEAALFSITNSRTFRFLQKLRRLVAAPRTLCKGSKQVLKSAANSLSRRAIRIVSAKPRLKSSALRFLRKYPYLEQKLRRHAFTISNRLDQALPPLTEATTLSTRGSRVFSQLNIAIDRSGKGAA